MKEIRNVLLKTDEDLFFIIYGSQKAFLNKVYELLTFLGGTYAQISLIALLSAAPSTRPIGLKLGIVQIVVTVVVQMLKKIASRVRPYDAFTYIIPLRTEKDFSFPSGHTAAAFSCAYTLSSWAVQMTVPIFALACFIAYSRVYLGTHYPSDVIAGCAIGTGLASILQIL